MKMMRLARNELISYFTKILYIEGVRKMLSQNLWYYIYICLSKLHLLLFFRKWNIDDQVSFMIFFLIIGFYLSDKNMYLSKTHLFKILLQIAFVSVATKKFSRFFTTLSLSF